MGCGASAAPSGGAKYSERKSATATEDIARSSSPKGKAKAKAKGKAKSKQKKAFEAKDVEWHLKNCLDSQFELVKTLREAYPFDENKKKTVHKKENVRSGGMDDLLKADNWGTVEISDIGPTRLLCDVCGVMMVDLYSAPENPFYVCRNCQRAGRKLELCVNCFRNKKHEKAFAAENGGKSIGTASAMSLKKAHTRSGTRDLYASEGGGSSTGTELIEEASKHMTSGTYEGHFEEEGGKRKVSYELFFSAKGEISGKGLSGNEVIEVSGTYRWDALAYKPRVEWTEKHDWGTLSFSAFMERNKEIEGDFAVSDGGGGTGCLKYKEPPEP